MRRGLTAVAAALLWVMLLSCSGEARTLAGAERLTGSRAGSGEEPEATLPAPAGQPGAVSGRPVEPAPPTPSRREVARQMSRQLPAGLRPLVLGGELALLLVDLAQTGHPDGLCLAVDAGDIDQPDVGALADPARLYAPDRRPVGFHLVLFQDRQGTFEPAGDYDLGHHYVYDALHAVPLHRSRPLPVVVTAAFLSPEGRERELLIFSREGPPVWRTALRETLSSRVTLTDVDGDGTLDLLKRETAMEAGTGYETFLTWLRWNGAAFREVRTVTVVRALKAFLGGWEERLLSGDLAGLLDQVGRPHDLKRWRGELGDSQIAVLLFGLQDGEALSHPVRNVVFPEILENPFTAHDRRGSFFRLTFRIVDSAGFSYLGRTRVYMAANPFGTRQFFLLPPD